jgi:hypothetical protein
MDLLENDDISTQLMAVGFLLRDVVDAINDASSTVADLGAGDVVSAIETLGTDLA